MPSSKSYMYNNLDFQHFEYITIRYYNLLGNRSAIRLFNANLKSCITNRIMSKYITYDYRKIELDRKPLLDELFIHLLHPRFFKKWIESGSDIEDYRP